MKETTLISAVFHNYYGRHAGWLDMFRSNLPVRSNIFYNIVRDSNHNLREEIPVIPDNGETSVHFRTSSNLGKDIGGKLVLFDTMIRQANAGKYLLLAHDKESLHKADPHSWKKKLFRVLDRQFIDRAIQIMENDERAGLIAAQGTVASERPDDSLNAANGRYISEMTEQFGIRRGSGNFVAGTMFIARAAPLLHFFRAHAPLKIRGILEKGNVLDEKQGTITHSWERLLSWIITGEDYKLIEI